MLEILSNIFDVIISIVGALFGGFCAFVIIRALYRYIRNYFEDVSLLKQIASYARLQEDDVADIERRARKLEDKCILLWETVNALQTASDEERENLQKIICLLDDDVEFIKESVRSYNSLRRSHLYFRNH